MKQEVNPFHKELQGCNCYTGNAFISDSQLSKPEGFHECLGN